MIFKPFIKLHRITDISAELLVRHNISGLILDIDNTLSTHHGLELLPGLREWIVKMQNSGISLLILSNSKEKRVKPFAENLGLGYLSLGMKPLPHGYIKAAKKMGLKRKNTAIVGDQLFTDSLGGHISGVKPIITDPIERENLASFKVRRKLEDFLYKFYKFEV